MENPIKFYVTLCLEGHLGEGLRALDFHRKYKVDSSVMVGLGGSASATTFEIPESHARLFPNWFNNTNVADAIGVDYDLFAPGEIVDRKGYLCVADDIDRCKLFCILRDAYKATEDQ